MGLEKKPSSSEEMTELVQISTLVAASYKGEGKDAWISKTAEDGKYYVRDLRTIVDSKLTIPRLNPTCWINMVPIKITGFI